MKQLLCMLAFCAAAAQSLAAPLFTDALDQDLGRWTGQNGNGTVPIHAKIVDDPLRSGQRALRFDKKVFGGDLFTMVQFAKARYRLSFDYLGLCPAKDCGGVIGVTSDYPGRDQWLAGTAAAGFPTRLVDNGQWQHVDIDFDAKFDFHIALEQWTESAGAGGDVFFSNLSLTALDEKGGRVLASSSADLRTLTLQSKALGQPMRIMVFLPKGYDASKRYPVLYWLPPFNNTENDALYKAGLGSLANQLIAQGKIKPLIIVSPQTDNSWSTNTGDTNKEIATREGPLNVGRYEDYLIQEVIPFVERNFAADPQQSGRYIGGISMGGYGAIALALRHPTLFSRIGGHSPALVSKTTPSDIWYITAELLYPDNTLREQRDPFLLADKVDLAPMTFWLDSGEQDRPILAASKRLDAQLRSHNAKVTFTSAAGGHDSNYWNEQRKLDYLVFYAGQ